MAIDKYASNADLIVACAELGYLRKEWVTLDPTWGRGTFWQKWEPDLLIGSDIVTFRPSDHYVNRYDATNLPFCDGEFDAVVIDGPYKLNGTPTAEVDERYGVHEPTSRTDRMVLLARMLTEGARVYNGVGFLLFKCQDQVNGGKVRWQTHVFTNHAATLGLGLVDRLDILSYRPQPDGTRQVTARRNSSSMLVFKRGWVS